MNNVCVCVLCARDLWPRPANIPVPTPPFVPPFACYLAGTDMWIRDGKDIVRRSALQLARDFGHQAFVAACLEHAP